MKINKCLVKGCGNYSDAGAFVGELCYPCHEMLFTGVVHPKNKTFIGDLVRRVELLNSDKQEINEFNEQEINRYGQQS